MAAFSEQKLIGRENWNFSKIHKIMIEWGKFFATARTISIYHFELIFKMRFKKSRKEELFTCNFSEKKPNFIKLKFPIKIEIRPYLPFLTLIRVKTSFRIRTTRTLIRGIIWLLLAIVGIWRQIIIRFGNYFVKKTIFIEFTFLELSTPFYLNFLIFLSFTFWKILSFRLICRSYQLWRLWSYDVFRINNTTYPLS